MNLEDLQHRLKIMQHELKALELKTLSHATQGLGSGNRRCNYCHIKVNATSQNAACKATKKHRESTLRLLIAGSEWLLESLSKTDTETQRQVFAFMRNVQYP